MAAADSLQPASEPCAEVDRELLSSVEELLRNDKYHDVVFLCRDGTISCNRAFLAARCSYFDLMLYGHMLEASVKEVSVDASAAALQCILDYLYTGKIGSNSNSSWFTLLETASLAQQYMIPRVKDHIADVLVGILDRGMLFPALSYALSADLQPVIDKIWKALPDMLTRPFWLLAEHLSPEAFAFCLQHVYPVIGPQGSCCTMHSTTVSTEAEAMRHLLQYACAMRTSCSQCQANAGSRPASSSGNSTSSSGSSCSLYRQVCKDTAASDTAAAQQPQQLPRDQDNTRGSKSSLDLCTCPTSNHSETAPAVSASAGGMTTQECQPAERAGSVARALEPLPLIDSITTTASISTSSPAAACWPCCPAHQSALKMLLAQINWHLVPPSLLEELDSLQLLSHSALLEVYRAHRLSPFNPALGCFESPEGSGLHCCVQQGHQVVSSQSLTHTTATSSFPLTAGRYSWQVLVHTCCDLAWVGVSDGSVPHNCWGGREQGGWFYGSNDALCHAATTDHRAYLRYCGHSKWGDGTVVTVYLDMDAREIWFAVNGSGPKLGFAGLPSPVYPSVSIRSPGRVSFRFRPHMWSSSSSNGVPAGTSSSSSSPCKGTAASADTAAGTSALCARASSV